MKRFHIILTIAIAFTMVATAQNVPQGKMLPFNKMTKTSKVTPMRADVLITPPESAVIETDWALEGNYINNSTAYENTNSISVAFDGNDVYIKGMVFLCPDAWVKGTIDGTTATFANGQYAGTYNSSSIYLCGSSDGSSFDDVVFDYDADAKVFELTNFYLENTRTSSFSFYFYSYDIVVYKNIDQPVPTNVTVQPTTTTADVAWTENGDATSWNLRYRYLPEKLNYLWDFESADDIEGWMVIDNDNDGFYWEWANARYSTHSGNGVLVSASYDSENKVGLTPDNWLISPAIPMGGTASFWYAGQDPEYCEEVFGVYLFVGDQLTSLDDFVKIGNDVVADSVFQQYTIDLSGYEGIGCIAIRHYNVENLFYLNIDDFCVEQPGGEYPGEWQVLEGVTNPYTINNLTPNTDYEVQVQAVGEGTSDWSSPTYFTTLSIPDVYILGQINDQQWAANVGTKMAYNADDNIYTATITIDNGESFGFTTELAENNDEGAWNYIEPFRFGPESNGDFVYNDEYNGQPLQMTFDNYGAIVNMNGEYNVTVDLVNMKLIIEKVVPAHNYDKGDVNHDHAVNISDVTVLIDYLLGTGTVCEICADVNGDGPINIGDVTALIDLLLGNN